MTEVGLLLVGHGTRNAAGTQCVVRLRELVADRLPDVAVRHSFLELNDQTIQRGMAELVECGVSKAIVAPLLLFAAGHAKADIPRELLAAAPPRLELRQADALGCQEALVELSHKRYLEAIEGLPDVPPQRTCLVLVGRGSYDREALAEMHRFADLQRQRLLGATVEVSFIAMAEPSVEQAVERIAGQGFQRVVIQPHLLFPGELLDNLAKLTAGRQLANPTSEWILAPALAADIGCGGPADQLLVDAVVDRALSALRTISI